MLSSRHSFPSVDHSMLKSNLKTVMPDENKTCPADNDLLKNSLLYRQFQAEREEILKHECIESTKAGHEIGFGQAMTDWMLKHRSQWRKGHMMTAQSGV
jgi:hypothetical protein